MAEHAAAEQGGSPASSASGGRPLAGYAVIAGTYTAGLTCALTFLDVARVTDRLRARDIALFGVATGMLARLVTRDAVSAFLRAPFTEYQGPAGAGEVHERPRGTGLRHAIGELVTCPFCAAPWLATAFYVGAAKRPRAARLVASILSSVLVSDVVNQAYGFLRKRA